MGALFGKKTPEDKAFTQYLRNLFGVRPRNLGLFRQALRHKSAATEIRKGVKDSNERLEYLGDSILDAVIAQYLYIQYPYKDEGYLTKLRSKIVSRNNLNALAEALKLDKHLEVNVHQTIHHKSLLGNAFEALIGALYLERGYDKTRDIVINRILEKHIDLRALEKLEHNYKSKMLEWAQKERKKVSFRVTDEEDLGYKKIYRIAMFIEGEESGRGEGSSKKEAEQAAAEDGWKTRFGS